MYENDTWSDVLTNVKDVYYDNSRGIDSNSADARINSIANRVLGNRYDTVDMSAKLFGNRNNRTEIVDGEYPIISDAIGNITSYKGFTYSYLGRQLTGLYNNESGILYNYNADGQRISKSYDSIGGFALDYDYYYNGSTLAGFVLTLNDGADSQEFTVTFMYDENGEPFGFTIDGDSYYYVRNAQNDIFLIVDSDNQGVVLYQYDAWGNVTACYDTSDGSILSLVNPYTYRGYYYDIETGYYYLNSRYYSPQLHRFISADGYYYTRTGVLSHNLFAYCNNNPILFIDNNATGPILNWIVNMIDRYIGFKNETTDKVVPSSAKTIKEGTERFVKAQENAKSDYTTYVANVINNKSKVVNKPPQKKYINKDLEKRLKTNGHGAKWAYNTLSAQLLLCRNIDLEELTWNDIEKDSELMDEVVSSFYAWDEQAPLIIATHYGIKASKETLDDIFTP